MNKSLDWAASLLNITTEEINIILDRDDSLAVAENTLRGIEQLNQKIISICKSHGFKIFSDVNRKQ